MRQADTLFKRMMLVALLTAGFIASCTAAPPVATTPINNTQNAISQKVALQRPVFIEFYSTL